MKFVRLVTLLIFSGALYAQPGTPYDCFSVYTFSAATSQTGQNNSSSAAPCNAWRVTYTSTGFSSVTVQFETSPDNSNWTAVPNTLCNGTTVQPPCVSDGSNPIAADVMGSGAYRAYGKYVRIHVTGVTGTGSGQVVTYGYKGTSASALAIGSGGGGGGATATVSSSSYASFALACAAAVSGSIGLLVDNSLTGLTTQTCAANPIQFIPSGKLKPAAAQVITLSGRVESGMYQIFDTSTGGAGSIVTGPNTPAVYAEWFGAAGNGVTNDTAAIQAAISATFSTVQLLAKSYAFTSGLTISHNGETLAGQSIGQLTPYLGTTLTTATTTGDSIKLSGGGAGNCDGGGINAVTLRDFNIVHSAAQTVNASIDIDHGCLDNISNVYTYDSFIGIYLASSTLVTVEHTHHYFPTDSASSRYGIQVDGSVGSHEVNSLYFNFNTVTGAGSNHITGIYFGPGNVGDVYVSTLETTFTDYGIQVHPTTCSNTACNENIRITRLIADQILVAGLYINNITVQDGTFKRPSVIVSDIYVDTNVDNGVGIDINGTTEGVSINQGTLSALGSAAGTVGVSINNGYRNTISNVIFYGWKSGMHLVGTVGAVNNIIAGNIFTSQSGSASTTYIDMGSNADTNIITNNQFNGYYTTGIAFASDALANIAFPNIWDVTNATNAVTQGAGSWGNVVTGPGGTPPAISGCSATIGTNSTNAAGTFSTTNIGACTITLTFEVVVMGTAGNAWSCQFSNTTTANLFRQSGSLSTTAASGSGITASGDVLSYVCAAF